MPSARAVEATYHRLFYQEALRMRPASRRSWLRLPARKIAAGLCVGRSFAVGTLSAPPKDTLLCDPMVAILVVITCAVPISADAALRLGFFRDLKLPRVLCTV